MFDYEMSLEGKTADQLSDELTRINERLFKTPPASPIFNQLMMMRDQCQRAYSDKLMMQQAKHLDEKPLDIGTAESTEEELNLKEDELLLAVVHSYVKEPEKKK